MAAAGSPPHERFEPKLLTVLREGLTAPRLARDAMAGVVVGIVALPLAIAFAIASGVSPEQGLATAIVGGFVVALLGGSRVQVGGPTGAFVVIVYGVVQAHGVAGLAVATLMAGLMLVAMGLARLGSVIRFVPYPVTVGFTTGIAVLIAVSQVPELLGLRTGALPAELFPKLSQMAAQLGTASPWAAGVGGLSLALTALWPRLTHRVPGSLVALFATTALVNAFGLPVETIGDRFGAIPSALPAPALPDFTGVDVRALLPSAFTIALLAAIESLLCAVIADGMIGGRHRPNTELVAQGMANLASPLFGGIPVTGAIARTATNVKNGGRTPVSGIVHSVTLLAVMALAAPLAARIPMAALAGILLVVAWHMSEWRLFARLFRSPRSDVLVLLATFMLTVFVDLTVAIEAGVVLAALLFMRRMASLAEAGFVGRVVSEEDGDEELDLGGRAVPVGVEVFEVTGPFFFGAASRFQEALSRIEAPPPILVLRLRSVPAVDATALRALEDLLEKARRDGTVVLVSGLRPQPRAALERAGLLARIGPANVLPDIDAALAWARRLAAGSADSNGGPARLGKAAAGEPGGAGSDSEREETRP